MDVKTYHGVSLQDCKRECDKIKGCNNFRYCEDYEIATCILKTGIINEIEKQMDEDETCFTSYRVCDSHGIMK